LYNFTDDKKHQVG